MRTASVLKEDKEWEKAQAADRIVENFLKPVRKPRLQSHSVWPSRAASPGQHLTYTALCITYLLVVFRSGAENSQFWSTWFRFWRFTRINETHDERFQMLTFLQ